MVNKKITELTEISSLASDDLLIVVDVSDTTDSINGTTKKILYDNIISANSPIFTGLTVDTNTLYVDNVNHRIGIGTTSPTAKTHIVQSEDTTALLIDSEASNGTAIFNLDMNSVNTGAYFQVTPNGDVDSGCVMRIGSDYMWVDSSSDLRKHTSYPTADDDGVVIGLAEGTPARAFTIVVGNANKSGDIGYNCDGTNDEVEIQAAIDAVDALDGGTVFLRAGTYVLHDSVEMKPNIRLTGDGYATILTKYSGGGQATWEIIKNDENTPASGVSIDNLHFRGLSTDGASTNDNQELVSLDSSNYNVNIHDCYFGYTNISALRVGGPNQVVTPPYSNSGKRINIHDNIFYDCRGAINTEGHFVVVDGNICVKTFDNSSGEGVDIQLPTEDPITSESLGSAFCIVSNNIFVGYGADAIDCAGSDARVDIIGNYVYGKYENSTVAASSECRGIVCGGYANVTGNMIENIPTRAIYSTSQGKGTITGNYIRNVFGETEYGTCRGIEYQGRSEIVISNNIIEGGTYTGGSSNNDYSSTCAIIVFSSSNYIVSNNLITNFARNSIHARDSNAGKITDNLIITDANATDAIIAKGNNDNIMISNNYIDNTSGAASYGIRTNGGDYMNIDHNIILMPASATTAGIYSEGTLRYSRIQDNTIDCNDNCDYGIRLGAGSSDIDNIIMGNIILKAADEGIRGFKTDETGGFDRCMFNNNILRGCANQGIRIDNMEVCTIDNNIIDDCGISINVNMTGTFSTPSGRICNNMINSSTDPDVPDPLTYTDLLVDNNHII